MAFFKRHKTENGKGFDLFGAYAFYIPGGTGIFWLTVMFMLGAILGNLITVGLAYGVSANFATRYGMLISYPVMFIPAMLFASSASRRHIMFEDGIALDSKNFGKYQGWCMALIVSIATIATAFVTDIFNVILPQMPETLKKVFEQIMGGPLWVTLLCVSVFAPFFGRLFFQRFSSR